MEIQLEPGITNALTSRWSLHLPGATRNHSKTVQEFFLNIAMCNTVVVTNPHRDTVSVFGGVSRLLFLSLSPGDGKPQTGTRPRARDLTNVSPQS